MSPRNAEPEDLGTQRSAMCHHHRRSLDMGSPNLSTCNSWESLMKKEDEKAPSKPYVWVTDVAGNEFLCPAVALKDVRDASDEELKNCIDVAALKPYAEDL